VGQTFAGSGRRTQWARRAEPAGYLSGLITCAPCGHKLRDVNADTPRASYACVGRYARGDCPAPAAARISAVDGYVVGLIEDEGADRRILEALDGRRARWEAARDAVAAAEERLDRLIDSTAEMRDRARARRKVMDAESDLEAARAALYGLDAPGPEADEVDAAWRTALASVTLERADPARRRWQPVSERVTVTWAA
jgi:recombinase-like zinc beta ribbon protein